MKVLIAETDWRFAQQVRAYLEDRAHMVAVQAETRTLLDRAHNWQPDLVILSAELAELGALHMLTALSPRPAILLTEFMDRYDRAWRTWQIGGDEILMKPIFSHDELHAAVVTAMENAASGSRIWHAAAAKISA